MVSLLALLSNLKVMVCKGLWRVPSSPQVDEKGAQNGLDRLNRRRAWVSNMEQVTENL